MEFLRSHDPRHERARLIALVLICLLLYFVNLGGYNLWDIDEGMHASISKEMVLTGDWVTPTVNGEPFFDKTPLYNWFAALAFLVFGFTEFAARLPAALFGLAGVLLTYRFGRRMFDPATAFLGAAVLATSLQYVALSRTVVHDVTLAVFVALALFSFYRAYAEERGRTGFMLLAYAAAGFAVLAKGPIGLVIPTGVIGLFLLVRRDLGFLRRMVLVRGALVVLAIAAPWFVLVSLANDSYLGYFLLDKNIGSFVSSESTHPQPVHYYLPALLLGLLPWSCYLPVALVQRFRERVASNAASLFVLIWCGFVFLFFSAATSKLATYMLPLFPPAALLVGQLWSRMLESADRVLRRGVVAAHLVSMLLAAAVVYLIAVKLPADPEVGPWLPSSIVWTAVSIVVVGGLVTTFAVVRGNYRLLFAGLAASSTTFLLFFVLAVAPGLDEFKSVKTLSRELDAGLPPGERIVYFYRFKDSAFFYTERKAIVLRTREQLVEHLSEAGAHCVIDEKRLEELADPDAIRAMSREWIRQKDILVLEGLGRPAPAIVE